MFTLQQLATLRAALRYWQEEMCPHGAAAMRPYLGTKNLEPLSSAEVARLGQRLQPKAIRYVLYDCKRRKLASPQLWKSMEAAVQQAHPPLAVATVLLP
jgi:hypothetical protein